MANTKKRKIIPLKNKTLENGKLARKPLVESAYERIHEAVSNGTFEPGHRMLEAEIASWLDMSRTPVREALRRLVDQDILSYDRYGNLVVTEIDRQMIIEIYAMREVLEGAAARLAARHAYDEEIETLQELAENYASEPPSRRTQLKLNNLLHQSIVQAAHNRYLIRSFDALPYPVRSFSGPGLNSPGRFPEVSKEHREIVKAIANRDAGAAEEAAKQHIRSSQQNWLRLLKEDALKD